MSSVDVLIGGQFGSEGKGVIAKHLAERYAVHVRVGGPNAGHTFSHEGKIWKMQTVPCGWTNPDAALVIGRGAVFSPDLLRKEMRALDRAGYKVSDRLFVDPGALVIQEHHAKGEGGVAGEMHRLIGSTGEGVGLARADRLSRIPGRARFAAEGEPWLRTHLYDTVALLDNHTSAGSPVMLEGTQGFGLSLVHGFWPFVTSHDTTAAQLCADAGVGIPAVRDVIMVIRTHPIRVAGNSGPLSNEITWDQLSAKLGREVVETTTVTNKIRRVGQWDESLFLRAVMVNRPTKLAVTFLDYLDPAVAGGGRDAIWASELASSFVRYLEAAGRVPVKFAGTGGPEFTVAELH